MSRCIAHSACGGRLITSAELGLQSRSFAIFLYDRIDRCGRLLDSPAARVDTSPSFGPFLSERHARSAYRVLRGVKRFDVEKRFGFSRCIRVFLWSRIVAMILVGAISPSPCGEMTERCGRQPAARAYCVRHYCIARS